MVPHEVTTEKGWCMSCFVNRIATDFLALTRILNFLQKDTYIVDISARPAFEFASSVVSSMKRDAITLLVRDLSQMPLVTWGAPVLLGEVVG